MNGKKQYNHQLSFEYSKYENAMALSVYYYWKIKREVKFPNIIWRVFKKAARVNILVIGVGLVKKKSFFNIKFEHRQ